MYVSYNIVHYVVVFICLLTHAMHSLLPYRVHYHESLSIFHETHTRICPLLFHLITQAYRFFVLFAR